MSRRQRIQNDSKRVYVQTRMKASAGIKTFDDRVLPAFRAHQHNVPPLSVFHATRHVRVPNATVSQSGGPGRVISAVLVARLLSHAASVSFAFVSIWCRCIWGLCTVPNKRYIWLLKSQLGN